MEWISVEHAITANDMVERQISMRVGHTSVAAGAKV